MGWCLVLRLRPVFVQKSNAKIKVEKKIDFFSCRIKKYNWKNYRSFVN